MLLFHFFLCPKALKSIAYALFHVKLCSIFLALCPFQRRLYSQFDVLGTEQVADFECCVLIAVFSH